MNPYRLLNHSGSLDPSDVVSHGASSIVNFNHSLSTDDVHSQMERLNLTEPAQKLSLYMCAGTVAVLCFILLLWILVVVIHPEILPVISCWATGVCAHLVS